MGVGAVEAASLKLGKLSFWQNAKSSQTEHCKAGVKRNIVEENREIRGIKVGEQNIKRLKFNVINCKWHSNVIMFLVSLYFVPFFFPSASLSLSLSFHFKQIGADVGNGIYALYKTVGTQNTSHSCRMKRCHKVVM